MEASKTPSSEGRPPLRRGQVRNRIIRDFFMSLVALTRPRNTNGGGGGGGGGGGVSGTDTSTTGSAYHSEESSDS